MDFSKLLNAIRGNKAADASAAPKDRPETEPVIPVEVSPTVVAADHPPPPVRTSGSVVQSLLGQFTGGHREPSPPTPPKTPPPGTANSYGDGLTSTLPPGAAASSAAASSPATADTGQKTPPLDTTTPIDGDWFDVSLDEKAPAVPPAVDVPVLDLPPDVPAPNVAPASVPTDALLTAPPVAPAVAPFEVSGRVDLSWTPAEAPAAPSVADFSSTDFPSQGDGMDTGPPPASVASMTVPPAITQPVEAFLTESTYVPPPPMEFPSAAGGFSQGVPMEAPLAPVNNWGFPPADTPVMPSTSVAAPVSAAGTVEPVAASVPDARPASWSDWLIENLDEALMVLDAQGILQQVNPMAEYLLGAPRQNLLGRSLLDISQQLGSDNAPLWEHLSVTTEAQQFSTNVMLPDGQSMMASFVVLELPAQDPWPGGRVIAIRDETRLRAEFAQMMEDLSPPPAPVSALQVTPEQLTAMRTSLQMVLGFAELLHRGEYGPMNPQQFEMFRNIEHHAKQLAEWLGLPQ
ncbi:PAS domain-containing protein [Chloracidobacterium thermophilum]|uniref:PAS fold protein n=1 Tax=Chloracidobacterium thermophilum (strain B) TaxID=981222 RepID=G2LFK5_CHLTF|nr:PAS domain-containing protein [Chloracidobacterium thermophilum]AEP11406.1 PAS fold protein [Chloracidobacterium thermophilum B]QUV79309.1 PAS domain-containing protein [Chloracidobacterium thermophilum]